MTSGSMQSPISPSTDDLNLKIASVKKVWETMAPVAEHPEDVTSSVAFSSASFSAVDSVSSGLDHSPSLENSFTPKETTVGQSCEDQSGEGVGYQGASSLQQGPSSMGGGPMVYTSSSAAGSLVKAEVSRSGNVCKVKPQQQATNNSVSPGPPGSVLGITGSLSPPPTGHSTSSMYPLGGTAAFGGIGGAIPSPPMVFNSSQQLPQTGLYQPLFEGTQVMGQRGASQFSQYPPYGLGQGLGSSFGGQSMFLTTPPPLTTPADLYSNSLSQYRIQHTGFGQNQPQNQNTLTLISSASNTLMSSAVKPSSQTFGNSQQNFGTIGSKAGTPFQQSGMGTAMQGGPQPSLYIYDPNLPMGPLVQRGPAVQSSVIQAIQPPSSYYSNNGAGGAPGAPPSAGPPTGPAGPAAATAGFYTASGSPLQAAVQQQVQPQQLQTAGQAAAAFGLQGFGNQSAGGPGAAVGMQGFGSASMSLAAQQLQAQPFRGGPTLPGSFLKSLQPGANLTETTARQQMKSPGAPNTFANNFFPPTSGIVTSAANGNINAAAAAAAAAAAGFGGQNNAVAHNGMTNVGPQVSSPKSQNRKINNNQPVGIPPHQNPSSQRNNYQPQQNTQQMIRGGLGSSGMVMGLRAGLSMAGQQTGVQGPGAPMNAGARGFPGPIQRPPASQGPGPSVGSGSHRGGGRGPPQGQQQQQQRGGGSSNPPSSAQQAKLRAEALTTTQAFFNRDHGGKSEKKSEDKSAESSSKEETPKEKGSGIVTSSTAEPTPTK